MKPRPERARPKPPAARPAMASTARRKASPASFLLKLREVLAREDPAVISWDGDGRITIGDPKRLGDEVLALSLIHI